MTRAKGPALQVQNDRAVQAALDELGREAADISAPTRTVLAIGLDAARGAAPHRTGELLAGLDTVDISPAGGALTARAPHSRHQEFGTRFVRGRHFMRAGADAIERAASDAYREDVEKKMRKAAQKA